MMSIIPNHQDNGGVETIESLVADGMNRLTIAERGHVYEEIHGVKDQVKETPELVASSLAAIQEALDNIRHKDAYLQAELQNYEYVHETSFRLMFLRAEYFDPRLAANRMVQFLEGKLSYFGSETLTRPLLLSDLDKNDLEVLKSGVTQFLPSRDRSGRIVLFDAITMFPRFYKGPLNMVKAFLYQIFSIADDEETQKRGLVGIYFHMGPLGHQPETECFIRVTAATKWFPIRYSATHLCSDRALMPSFVRATLAVAPRELKARFRLHEGSLTECHYKLMTFGIPIEAYPISTEGELKKSNHLKWMKRREAKDRAVRSSIPFNKIDFPAGHDVLVGKGKPFQQHSGNIRLRDIVRFRFIDYRAAKKGQKMAIAKEIVMTIKTTSGRFLKKDVDGWWVEVTDEDAREKVGKTFGSIKHPPPDRQFKQNHRISSNADAALTKFPKISPENCCSFCS